MSATLTTRDDQPGAALKPVGNGSKAKPRLGLAMIMKNEEANLPRSLAPLVPLVDEAVVVDTGSTDRSPALARAWGARVLDFNWGGDFAAARNFGLAAAAAEYILWLDADNSLTPEGLTELRGHLKPGGDIILQATEVVVPQGEKLWQKRVFPNRPGQVYFQGRIHEQLVHPGHFNVIHTGVEIRHWGYAEAVLARQKGERNLELLLGAPETGDFYWLYQTGRTLFTLRRFSEARPWLEKAIAAGPPLPVRPTPVVNPSLWGHSLILLSQALRRLGQLEAAEEAARRLVEARPDYGPGHYHLGRLLFETGRPAEAAPHLETSLVLGPGDKAWGADPEKHSYLAALLLGRVWAGCGRLSPARQAFDLARRLNPGHPEPPFALAETALAQNRPAEAREYLKKTLSLAPGHRRALELFASLGTPPP
ncbi:MAG: glycosyltransferase [Deltaproteobacteria bacterium]|nr:glycosyltransferase [Deltaproteobacteria bacterium]